MFNVYNDHGSTHVILPPVRTVDEARTLAETAAAMGRTAFYRLFRQTRDSVSGERFETAFSVVAGEVREHRDVTIPAAHWPASW